MRMFPFLLYLRQNIVAAVSAFILSPLFMVLLCWLFGMELKLACMIALACEFWMFASQYGTFETANKIIGPMSFADFFKRELIGVTAALILGYPALLLFVAIDPLLLGASKGYFFASASILLYYLGRYIGINNGLPILKKLLVYLGLPVPPDNYTRKGKE